MPMRSGSVSVCSGDTGVVPFDREPGATDEKGRVGTLCRVPVPILIERRPGIGSITLLSACALILLACSSTPTTTDRVAPTTADTTVDLVPDDGVVRVTVPGTDGEPGDVLLVGDSVLVLVADDLAANVGSTLHVDAADCRRLERSITGPCGGVPAGVEVAGGIDAVRSALAAAERPPDAAVFVLANNSSITRADVDAVMAATAGIDHVWWVNTRIVGFGRQDPNNRVLAEVAATDPRAGLVDWFTASEGEAWLTDNVHPNDAGQAELAALIEDRLRCGCTA